MSEREREKQKEDKNKVKEDKKVGYKQTDELSDQ